MKIASLVFAIVLATAMQATPEPSPKRVALVFDDGPVPEHTTQFLAVFAREQVKATFSHEGRFVAARPDLARAVLAAGHEIANHSYTHPHFKDLPADEIVKELRDTQAALHEATGREPVWVWTPFLEWNDSIAAAVATAGLRHFPLSQVRLVSSDDWNPSTDAATLLRNATTGIEDRTIILCHEFRAETLAQLPAMITELKKQGCTFLTFSELAATLTDEQRAMAH